MFEQWANLNLLELPKVNGLNGYLFSEDNGANKFGVIVKRGYESVTLTGSVKAWIIRPDGETLEVNGDKSENRAWIILPEEAYEVPGHISIFIKLINGTEVSTLCAVDAYVYKTTT